MAYYLQKLIVTVVVVCFTMIYAEHMPYIVNAIYKNETKAIEFLINYTGGCAEHKFRLDIGGCLESMPVQCLGAKLIDLTTNDYCKADIQEKIIISLREAALDTDYYEGASVQIHGAAESKASVRLPR